MNAHPIRRVLRALLPGRPVEAKALVVQHLGFEPADLDTLPAVLDEVGRELGVSLRLDGISGDLVLAEQAFIARVAPQVLNAFLDERPLMTMPSAVGSDRNARRRARQLHAELTQQFRALSLAAPTETAAPADRGAAPAPTSSGYDSQFDTRQHAERLAEADLDRDRAELLKRLRRGLVDPAQPLLETAYGPKATLVLDFASGVAYVDELADQRLRVTRELPYLARGSSPETGCKQRELDLVAWDIAAAAGGFRLLNSPVNWWHTPLAAAPGLDVSRFSALPRHLDLARVLSAHPVSPAELRRRCRVSLSDLRSFLQAALFLGLVQWMPVPRT